MSDENEAPNNTEILTALQGMWRQQKDLIQGVEGRLGAKLDDVEKQLEERLAAGEQRLGERLAQEIRDRPVVVHVDMGRVTELEKQVKDLAGRIAELESRDRAH